MIDNATLMQLALDARAKANELENALAEAGMLDEEYLESDGALMVSDVTEAANALHLFVRQLEKSAVREP